METEPVLSGSYSCAPSALLPCVCPLLSACPASDHAFRGSCGQACGQATPGPGCSCPVSGLEGQCWCKGRLFLAGSWEGTRAGTGRTGKQQGRELRGQRLQGWGKRTLTTRAGSKCWFIFREQVLAVHLPRSMPCVGEH